MDLIIYLAILIVVLGFGLLSAYDRIFGIVAILIGLIGGLYLLSDNTIFTNRVYDATNAVWISYTIPASQVSLLAILLGVCVAIDSMLIIRNS